MSGTSPILFATDGSPSARDAQDRALALARALDAPLLVVSVSNPPLPPVGYAGYGYADVVTGLREAQRAHIEELLESTATTAAEAGVPCETASADGTVVEEICRIAAERHAQMIVVGSHGWGAARRLFSGSVSTALVHSAPCPVLVVRPHEAAQEQKAAA